MELIQNRKSIKNSLARAETNYNKLVYQPSNTVTVIRDSDRRTKRENKRSRKKQTAQTTNLEILGYLGFDSEFLKENNKLGLKS